MNLSKGPGFGIPNISLKVRPLQYGYSNARVHGMKGLLLTKDSYENLLNLETTEAMIEFLQRTHYKTYLLDAAAKYTGSRVIESASGKHYAAIASKLKTIAPKADVEIIDALLAKWDVINLKLVVVSKKHTKNFSEIKPSIVAAGSLTEDDLKKIYEADERDIFNELRRTKFGRELFSQSTQRVNPNIIKNFRKAFTIDNYSQLQAILDTYGYVLIENFLGKYLAEKDVRNIYAILQSEIDALNISTIERLKRAGITDLEKVKQYIIDGGTLRKLDIPALVESKELSSSLPIIKRRFSEFNIEGVNTIVDLEIAIQKALAARKLRIFHGTLFSVGTLLGFLLLKETEMNNLRKIAKGKEFGISKEDLMNSLLIGR